jgi:hypothetical protein
MKVYRFGKEPMTCYHIIIIENDGEIRVSFIGLETIKEYIAEKVDCGDGIIRLMYGAGSSMPYISKGGELCDKYTLLYED